MENLRRMRIEGILRSSTFADTKAAPICSSVTNYTRHHCATLALSIRISKTLFLTSLLLFARRSGMEYWDAGSGNPFGG
jgi:hypothetical protein